MRTDSEIDFSWVVVESLSNCLTQLQTLPEQVPLFLVSVFDACSRHHNDAHLARIARDLSHAIVRSLSYNARLSPQFDQVLEPALTFLQVQPTAAMLDAILTILMLVTEGQRRHALGQRRFNLILDIVAAVEGDEPSDATFRKFQNVLNSAAWGPARAAGGRGPGRRLCERGH
jgi:hypothetical protein